MYDKYADKVIYYNIVYFLIKYGLQQKHKFTHP